MGQEKPEGPKPDCPYPAFEEISIEQIEHGTILDAPTLIDYFFYVMSKETIRIGLNTLKPSLMPACMYILSLLQPGEYVPYDSNASDFLTVINYEQSDVIMNYSDPAFPPDSLADFDALGFMHGGFVGLNEAHFEVLAQLAMRTRMTHRGIVLGLERDEYLQTKARDTLRPWPLIVTVSLFAHLAQRYKIPLRIFIMPVPPESSGEYDAHYTEVYARLLNRNSKTTLVVTPGDPYSKQKYERMSDAELTPADWNWTEIRFVLSASTGIILNERDSFYQSLVLEFEPEVIDIIGLRLFSGIDFWLELLRIPVFS